MMIHEKLMSGQFLLDFKSDHAANLLHAHAHPSHHSLHALHAQVQQQQQQHQLHLQQQQQQQQKQQLLSPPMPTAAAKMDLYSAYAYQQHLQQQMIGSASSADLRIAAHARSPLEQSATGSPMEVLDLSRRCDSLRTPPRKTPSPYHSTTSSLGTVSPAHSPPNTSQSQPQQAAAIVPANLLYSSASHDPHSAAMGLPLPADNLAAALYPALYYPGTAAAAAAHIKPEASSPLSITPPLSHPAAVPLPADNLPKAATNTLLQTFASAAAVAAASSKKAEAADPTPLSPVGSQGSSSNGNGNGTKPNAIVTTPTSSTSASAAAALATLDAKSTRPFKAFPRDPLVIAANFAASDVLLDNPLVERYTEYRKRVLEQIRSSNGGARTVTNPKMRRTNSRSGSINDGCSSSNNNSENDERSVAAEESSDCDSNAGNFEKLTNNNNTSSSSETLNANSTAPTNANGSATAASALFGGCSQVKDAAYYERRRKNNAAAKKSRDRRRIKEDEIAIRAAYLERQNIELLCQIDALKAQLAAFTSKVGA